MSTNKSRRKFLINGALVGASAIGLPAQQDEHRHPSRSESKTKTTAPAKPGKARPASKTPDSSAEKARGPLVEMPDLKKAPWEMEDGVKVFNISADVVKREFLPGKLVDCWGFNDSMPGPLI